MLKPEDFRVFKCFMSDISLSANPEFDIETSDRTKPLDWDFDLDCLEREDDVYVVRFNIKCEDERSPYIFEFQAFAYLGFEGNSEKTDNHKKSAAAYGLQVLYGMAREYLLLLSNRGPWSESNSVWLGLCDVGQIMEKFKEKLTIED